MSQVRHLENEEGDVLLIAPELTLRFFWTGDRWSHALESQGRALAVSLEGPDLPAFQQLHVQPDGDGESWLALAVGQSGLKHYSASFRVSPLGRVEVDIADRGEGLEPPLAPSYAVDAGPDSAASLELDADDGGISWAANRGRLTMWVEGQHPPRLAVAEAGPRGWRIQAVAEAEVAADSKIASNTTTRRCRVVWSFSSSC